MKHKRQSLMARQEMARKQNWMYLRLCCAKANMEKIAKDEEQVLPVRVRRYVKSLAGAIADLQTSWTQECRMYRECNSIAKPYRRRK